MKELNELVELAEIADSVGNTIDCIDPHTILAIAKAFLALEQEKEAAARYAERLNTLLDDREATLSRYEVKQEPVAYTDAEELKRMRKDTYADMFTPCFEYQSKPEWTPLFTRPTADLRPDDIKRDAIRYRFLRESDYFGAEDEVGLASWDDLCDLSCNDFDAAVDARMNHPDSLYTPMLQNIEDGK
jgi:hypothetical protein